MQVSCFPKIDGQLGWYESSVLKEQLKKSSNLATHTYDVVVIGAGFTGLAVVSRLLELEPDLKIAVVDALKVGQGTSGRNAGFIIDLPHNLDSSAADINRDKQIHVLNCFAIDRLQQASLPYAKEVAWHKAGKYLAAHESKHIPNLESFALTLREIGADYEMLEGKQLGRKLGTDYYQQAVYTPGNILMNPAALIQAIALSIGDKVDWYEEMPVRSINKNNNWEVQLDEGCLHAEKVILAVNSYAEEFNAVKNRLAPVFTYASLTRSLTSAELQGFDGVEAWGVTSAHPAGTTVRFTSDKRIFIRNSFDFRRLLVSEEQDVLKAQRQHVRSFNARFPQLKHVAFEYTWGGMLCMTMNHQSAFLEKSKGLYAIAGCNGVGVAKGTYLGAYMAEYMLGKSSAELDFIHSNSNPSWVVPEPLRSIGATVRFAYEQYQARGEI